MRADDIDRYERTATVAQHAKTHYKLLLPEPPEGYELQCKLCGYAFDGRKGDLGDIYSHAVTAHLDFSLDKLELRLAWIGEGPDPHPERNQLQIEIPTKVNRPQR